VAGNIIPDVATVSVNYRFAPSRSIEAAEQHVRDVFDGFEVEVIDAAPAAAPGLTAPAASSFVAAVGGEPRPKYGWTDVARFAALGIPAVNYGPGNPDVAHSRDEYVMVPLIRQCQATMRAWLLG
jgi:succinyl-diaminopimelate desuccinylase